ncbi:dihydrofolate reductase [Echinococcus multilocularis]|uniref:dihydrofolate reductase n=1 Tax=Echinococcus multilocularis TaxID=6211 RepID=A0A068Y1C7_ECHMU|nr:dihydrofolate reductase [Echinococcus multilocularis]
MGLRRLSVIAAVANNGGIGKENKLPWKIREDMAFFSRITSTAQEGKKNAVILGRRTWLSFPPKFRPLPSRINVVVSTQLESVPEGTHLVKSFEDSLRLLESLIDSGQVDEVFIIGGHGLYKEALEQEVYPVRLYYTHIMKDFDCDTFFPSVDWERFKPIQLDTVDSSLRHSGDVEFRFAVYEKQPYPLNDH